MEFVQGHTEYVEMGNPWILIRFANTYHLFPYLLSYNAPKMNGIYQRSYWIC